MEAGGGGGGGGVVPGLGSAGHKSVYCSVYDAVY